MGIAASDPFPRVAISALRRACPERARDAAEVEITAAILVGRQVAEVGQTSVANQELEPAVVAHTDTGFGSKLPRVWTLGSDAPTRLTHKSAAGPFDVESQGGAD